MTGDARPADRSGPVQVADIRATRPSRVCGVALAWEQVVVDARDPQALGSWWATALDWQVVHDSAEEVEIRQDPVTIPGLLFIRVEEGKTGKNRLHIDVRPQDQRAEVSRLITLGASPVDVGQGKVSWVVLADPEGNEFCVLRDAG